MRSRSRNDDFDEEVEVQMTPLIDCVFLLLVFFLVAATLKKPHKELEINLPASLVAPVAESRYDTLIIEVTRQGEYYIDSQPMTKQMLNERLHEVAAATPDRRVRIDTDAATPAQDLVRLLDHLQFVRLTNVHVRTKD